MSESTVASLFLIAFGVLPCFLSGYFMAINQKRGLISLWNDKWFTNPEKAANYLGWSLLLTASLLLTTAVLLYLQLISNLLVPNILVPILFIPVCGVIGIKIKYGKN
ncbi:hypothetical protein [Thalassotalea sp. PLHSN55]|uniref:hypothetical protein n=1 Tax=Thalassotalea sp. PLHSN55 TaxID=3435888 RepID=UPI003F854303